MLNLNVVNETSKLKAVVLGTAVSLGPAPKLEDCIDPKSREHILNNTYPIEEDLTQELEEFFQVLKKYDVVVYRPEKIENYNQIFSRDIAFVIDNKFVFLNIKAGFYKIFAYEDINSISDTYFNGSIDPLRYAAKFNFYNDIIEVRPNWDIEGITLIIN